MVDKQRERAVTCSSRRGSMSVMAFRGDVVAVFRVCGRFELITVHRYRPAQRAGVQPSIRRERQKTHVLRALKRRLVRMSQARVLVFLRI